MTIKPTLKITVYQAKNLAPDVSHKFLTHILWGFPEITTTIVKGKGETTISQFQLQSNFDTCLHQPETEAAPAQIMTSALG